jgi:hypothetical protein
VIDTFANRSVALRDLHANPFRITVGKRPDLPRQILSWMRWDGRFVPAALSIRLAWFITVTEAGDTCLFVITAAWLRRASNHPLAASATPMIEPVDAIRSRPQARALAKTINGLCKTKVIRRRSS